MGFLSVSNSFTFSLLAITAIAIAFLSAFIWWLIRKRLRDFWMPIVRVFDLPVSRLPRVVVKKPPMVPFIAFCVAALAFALWTTRPTRKVFSDFEPGMQRVHVFVDMSPSISAHISLNDLGDKIVALLEQIGPKSRVSFGTSHGNNVYEVSTASSASELITGLGFHRGGAKIGSGVRDQIARIGDIDQLFVISDRDQHSWSGFQWQYLTVDADVRHVDLDDASRRGAKPNIFIQEVRYLSGAGARTMDWDVEISLGVLAMPVSGTITASIGGDSLASANWENVAGRRSSTVSLSWPASKIPDSIVDDAIEWNIEVAGGDAMQMDNKFRSPVRGRRDRVVVIGEPAGELRLEDPLISAETALRVAGYDVIRYDRWPKAESLQDQESFANAGIIVSLVGEASGLDSWCPGGGKNGSDMPAKLPPIWLTPRALEESFSAMCFCVAKQDVGITADMCSGKLSRNDWIATLAAVGAKQVGGELGATTQAVAMKLNSAANGRDLMVFTVPIRPLPQMGLTWGVFPVMVKQMAQFTMGQTTGDDGAGGTLGAWPRLGDVSRAFADREGNIESNTSGSGNGNSNGNSDSRTRVFRTTNVPVGESLLAVVATVELPPSWSTVSAANRDHAPNKRDNDDAWLWVQLTAGLVFLSLLVEALWLVWRSRKVASVTKLSIAVLLLSGFYSGRVSAQVHIDWLSARDSNSVSFAALAREVSGRTSLELSPKPEMLSTFNDTASSGPWIWTNNPMALATKNGQISDQGRLWLKRGGILIIDGAQPQGTLERLLEPLMHTTVRPSGWMALPPDHEFMRSFYLLSSLPTCKGRPWRIFSFDGRVVAIESPYSNLALLQDSPVRWSCESNINYEQHVRIFVNLMMMAFTTDYKKDQIHLPEILKRLRVP